MTIEIPNFEQTPRAEPIPAQAGDELNALLKDHKISDTEFATLQQALGRLPTMAELGVFSSMWSEHCSYKSSRVHLSRFPTKGEQVVQGPGENAGIVRLSDKLCAAFKMESHNHPSYIEPYQGAATGVGGILRDVFCMGARPVANLNALRFGRRAHQRTPYLVENVVRGIGDYGNCVGIPTVGGNVSFDASYDGNCLVNAMTVGLIHEDRIFRGYATGAGNLVVYLGSATGRDGIHGATMASDSFASDGGASRTTVQVGDPFTEKLLLEATLDVLEAGLVVGLQDMGAAGLTSSSFEMAERAGSGLYLDLDKVPTRTTAMTAYELLLSESQERMLMVVEPAKLEELKNVLAKWQLAFAVIGVVTDSGRVQCTRNGVLEVDVPVGPVTDLAPKYDRPRSPRDRQFNEAANEKISNKINDLNPGELLGKVLGDGGNKAPIYQQYDHHIGTSTVRGPQEQGAAVMWMRSDWQDKNEPYLGMAIATACHERYCSIDAEQGGAHAVTKCARMIAAAGGKGLAITDCLNFGNPEDPAVMSDFSEAVDGISAACKAFDTPVVSGNVSLYNTTDGQSIHPTPMIGMVGRIDDVRQVPHATAQGIGDLLLLTPALKNKAFAGFGGSTLAEELGFDADHAAMPTIDFAVEERAMNALRQAIAKGLVVSCRDVGDGGALVTAAKMVADSGYGLSLNSQHAQAFWLQDLSASYLLQAVPGKEGELGKLLADLADFDVVSGMTVTADASIVVGETTLPADQWRPAWRESLTL